MILTGKEILNQIEKGNIEIDPFDQKNLNPNSLDLRLADKLLIYESEWVCGPSSTSSKTWYRNQLDMRKENPTKEIAIPSEGLVLHPGTLYLGSTIERTNCGPFAPMLEGKSSIARLGISIHATAGVGDTHFDSTWTMEISVIHPVRIYAGVRFAQLLFHEVRGEITKYQGKYQQQSGPVASRFWQGE